MGDDDASSNSAEAAQRQKRRRKSQPGLFVCFGCYLVQTRSPDEDSVTAGMVGIAPGGTADLPAWTDDDLASVLALAESPADNSPATVVEVAPTDLGLLAGFREKGLSVVAMAADRSLQPTLDQEEVANYVGEFGAGMVTDYVDMASKADLVVVRGPLSQAYDLNDFVTGLRGLVKRQGTIVAEVTHLLRLIQNRDIDQISTDRRFHFSLLTLERILGRHGLMIFDAQEVQAATPALRLSIAHWESPRAVHDRLVHLKEAERRAGMAQIDSYRALTRAAKEIESSLATFLDKQRQTGRSIAAYGSLEDAGLLRRCGAGPSQIDYYVNIGTPSESATVPGTRIPICDESKLYETKPDYVLVLSWRREEEIVDSLGEVRRWHGRFVIPVPELRIVR